MQIAASHTNAADVEFAHMADGKRTAIGVQDINLCVGDGLANAGQVPG